MSNKGSNLENRSKVIAKPRAETLIRTTDSIDWTSAPAETALQNFPNRLASAYLGNHLRSDITFYVEQNDVSIPAHSLIVAAGSPELERCCFGSGDCVLPGRVIVVSRSSASDFFVVLRHLYGAFTIDPQSSFNAAAAKFVNVPVTKKNAQDIGLTFENAAAVLMLADYYNLTSLKQECADLLLVELSVANVCAVYDDLHLLDDHRITVHCRNMILSNANTILHDILSMRSMVALKSILASDDLYLLEGEIQLFRAMRNWAMTEMTKSKKQLHVDLTQREVLNPDRLPCVRFACLSAQEFCLCVKEAGDGFFSDEEILTTIKHITFGIRNEANASAIASVSTTTATTLVAGDPDTMKTSTSSATSEIEPDAKPMKASVSFVFSALPRNSNFKRFPFGKKL